MFPYLIYCFSVSIWRHIPFSIRDQSPWPNLTIVIKEQRLKTLPTCGQPLALVEMISSPFQPHERSYSR